MATVPRPPAETIDAVLRHLAHEDPEREAIIAPDGRLSRRQLLQRAQQLAAALHERGVRCGDRVCVMVQPSVDLVPALVAALQVGAAYVPLDVAYPRDLVAYLVDDSHSAALLTDDPAAAEEFWPASRPVVATCEPARDVAWTVALPQGSDLCYLIYTSGSTGRPKGAMNRHSGVLSTLWPLARLIGLGPDDRLLQASSLNFDMSVFEIFGALLAGAAVVLPTAGEKGDPDRLLCLMRDEQVTAWGSAPQIFKAVVDQARATGPELPGSFRLAVLGGDRIPPKLVGDLAAMVPRARIVNVAGVTEVSFCSTYHEAGPADLGTAEIPWGRSLPGQFVYVLGLNGRPVPNGERGELYLGGDGVGDGYWRRPDLTASRFVPDPFQGDGHRMYRTGDVVALRADGVLEFHGREDFQVKIGGVRLELGHLENLLLEHPQIKDAVAWVSEHDGTQQLVAYVVGRPGHQLTAATCQLYLRRMLPDTMVPHRVVLLDQLPLLASGKVARGSLPAPDDIEDSPGSVDLTRYLGCLFHDVIGVGEPTTDFFANGGTSLSANRLMSRLRRELGLDLPIRLLFEASTPARLGRQILVLQQGARP